MARRPQARIIHAAQVPFPRKKRNHAKPQRRKEERRRGLPIPLGAFTMCQSAPDADFPGIRPLSTTATGPQTCAATNSTRIGACLNSSEHAAGCWSSAFRLRRLTAVVARLLHGTRAPGCPAMRQLHVERAQPEGGFRLALVLRWQGRALEKRLLAADQTHLPQSRLRRRHIAD